MYVVCCSMLIVLNKKFRQWRSSSFQESKKVRVSRDLWPWPWPWEHPVCRLTWWPSCASLVAIKPFAREKKPFLCKHKSARITWPLNLTLTLSTPWMQAYLMTIVWKFGGDRAIYLREEAIFVPVVLRSTILKTGDWKFERAVCPFALHHCYETVYNYYTVQAMNDTDK